VLQGDVGDVAGPDLIRPRNRQIPQQIRVNLVAGRRPTGGSLREHRLETEQTHQPLGPLPIEPKTLLDLPRPQLGRRPVTLGGRQGHLGLECRPKYSPLPSHRPAPNRVPPAWETTPYRGARKLGSISVHLNQTEPSPRQEAT
jgi:hypothetical protein